MKSMKTVQKYQEADGLPPLLASQIPIPSSPGCGGTPASLESSKQTASA